MKVLLSTDASLSLFVARITAGLVILPHGLQKTLGFFDGPGFSSAMTSFTDKLGIPWAFALLAILAESLGALGLIFGCVARIAALGVGTVMAVAIVKGGHHDNGFFMNWYGSQKGEGFEYHLLMIGLCLVVLIGGAGAFSIDRRLSGKTKG